MFNMYQLFRCKNNAWQINLHNKAENGVRLVSLPKAASLLPLTCPSASDFPSNAIALHSHDQFAATRDQTGCKRGEPAECLYARIGQLTNAVQCAELCSSNSTCCTAAAACVLLECLSDDAALLKAEQGQGHGSGSCNMDEGQVRVIVMDHGSHDDDCCHAREQSIHVGLDDFKCSPNS